MACRKIPLKLQRRSDLSAILASEKIMPHTQVSQDPSLYLNDTIIDTKTRKNLTWQQLAEHVRHRALAWNNAA